MRATMSDPVENTEQASPALQEKWGVAMKKKHGKKDLLTIGMPVFNDPEGVRKSASTIFNQSWPGEKCLLIIDDGSTDETPAVIEEMQAKYQKITVYRNERNRGRPYSRNRVLELAGGEYLAWIDSGDQWDPQKIELQFKTLERTEEKEHPLICTCPFLWVWLNSGESRVKWPLLKGDQLYNALRGRVFPYLWTMLGPLESFTQVGGFDERLPRRQDFDFLIRYLAAGGKMVESETERPLCTYYKTDVGRSGYDIARANHIIWQKHKPLYFRYGRRFAFYCRRRQFALAARFFRANRQFIPWLCYMIYERILAVLSAGPVVRFFNRFRKKAIVLKGEE